MATFQTMMKSNHSRLAIFSLLKRTISKETVALFLFLFGTGPLSADEPAPVSKMNEQENKQEVVSTFSIVAYDPATKEWGIGVASKFLAVGHVVPWAKAEQGAIATQSFANTTYGPEGLKLLSDGASASEVLKQLTDSDPMRANRQVGLVDKFGNAATFTGEKCLPWAGGKTGENFACQGNILAGPEVIEKMAKAFEDSEGSLTWRIMDALEAADEAGGDIRGRQSAAILVVKEGAGYAGFNDRMIDFRVDDHETPIQELGRILSLKLERPGSKEKDADDESVTEKSGAEKSDTNKSDADKDSE